MVVICHSSCKICVLSKCIYDYKREDYSLLLRCFKYLFYSKGKHFQLGYVICLQYFFFHGFIIPTCKSSSGWAFIRIVLDHGYHLLWNYHKVFCLCFSFPFSENSYLTEFLIYCISWMLRCYWLFDAPPI